MYWPWKGNILRQFNYSKVLGYIHLVGCAALHAAGSQTPDPPLRV